MVLVIFSCAQSFGGVGPSRPLTRVRDALLREYGDELVVVGPGVLPELQSETHRLGEAIGPCYDDLAAEFLRAMLLKGEGEKIVFIGSGGASHAQMRALRELGRSVVCGTLWFSSHFDHAERMISPEYAYYGVQAAAVHPYVRFRAAREQAESDFLIVPSEFCKSTYPGELQGKIKVAEFGVDLDEFTLDESRLESLKSNRPLKVLAPMSNPPRKGLKYVMAAWRALPMDRFQLTLTGPMPKGTIDQGKLDVPVAKSVGWVPDAEMRQLFREHDVLLLPSLEEGQALVSAESLASGMPVIVTPNVGMPISEKEGWVVPVKDARAIRDALIEAEKDRARLIMMSRNARVFAEGRPWRFFEDNIVRAVREVAG